MSEPLVQQALGVINHLFAKHDITEANQASRLIRERFTEDELSAYKAARDILDGEGVIG